MFGFDPMCCQVDGTIMKCKEPVLKIALCEWKALGPEGCSVVHLHLCLTGGLNLWGHKHDSQTQSKAKHRQVMIRKHLA